MDDRRPHHADDRHRHSDDRPRAGASSRLGPSSLHGPPSPAEAVPAQLPPPPVVPSQVVVKPAEPPLDRAKVCPLMLRVFTRRGGHHRLEDFARRGQEPDDEVSMYTWPDATLRELSDLVKEVLPDARQRQSRMGFALIYPDRNGRNIMRIVGQVHSSRIGDDDNKTLKQVKFQTGDFVDVAVF